MSTIGHNLFSDQTKISVNGILWLNLFPIDLHLFGFLETLLSLDSLDFLLFAIFRNIKGISDYHVSKFNLSVNIIFTSVGVEVNRATTTRADACICGTESTCHRNPTLNLGQFKSRGDFRLNVFKISRRTVWGVDHLWVVQ